MSSKVQFQKLSARASLPKRAHEGDAGLDLSSAHDVVIPARSTGLVKTDISVRLPPPPIAGTSVYGRIGPRSGLALKKNIAVGGGVIDQKYTGQLGVILHNHGDAPFEVRIGDRVGQFLIEVILTPTVEEVDDISTEVTERGSGGFGSSGV